ncbi:MAG TPA: hypothetical protein VHS96_00340 [Bacteroidia bacterium]|nr:hypothetical protein [Bacteroidia bacterium]
MGYTEFHIDGRYKLFGNFYHACVDNQNSSPFLAAHRTFMQAATDAPTLFHLGKFNDIDALGIFAANAQGDKFAPLMAHLVIPDGVGTAPYPLAILIHGQAPSYFGNNDTAIPEVKSYRGYRYLQRYLAEKGVASVSVNVNISNYFGGIPYFQPMERLELAFLVLAILAQLSGSPVTTDQPIFLQKSDGTLVPLQDGLALTPPFATGSQEQLLQTLKTDLQGKLSFTTLGIMGHSRAGETVQILQPFFSPRVGTAPTNYGTAGTSTTVNHSPPNGIYNSNTVGNHSFSIHQHLYHHILNIAAVFGSPQMSNLKMVVALQPGGETALLNTNDTFYLVVASSHDEDVQEGSFNAYENVNCPKAMIFSHGASHGRFNTVWRQMSSKRQALNRQIICQNPIRMLSNAGHENLAKATVGNALLAGLLGENHRYRFFTGEQRAPSIGQDIERAWKFPFPFTSPPALVLLDGAGITAQNTSTNTAVSAVTISNLSSRQVSSHENYANEVSVKSFTRPANQGLAIRIPITSANSLVTRTHFSFRYTKEYNARSASARNQLNLKHYTLKLKANTNVIGSPIEGRDVPSLQHPAYPTTDLVDGNCEDDTVILMQTAEVPLSQFLSATGQPTTDLNQVTAIEIVLNPLPGAGSGDETFFFVDFLLTTRSLPAPPAGFAIP